MHHAGFRRFFSSRLACSVSLLAVLAALVGCQSFESRAKEKASAFAALDAETRTRLADREIRVGDTPDMVYIALGKPAEKTENITAAGQSATWIYTAYWQEYQGTRFVGYRRDVFYNPSTKSYQVSYIPDYQPVYVSREEDRIRVTFQGGRVSVVEKAQAQAKPPGSTIQ